MQSLLGRFGGDPGNHPEDVPERWKCTGLQRHVADEYKDTEAEEIGVRPDFPDRGYLEFSNHQYAEVYFNEILLRDFIEYRRRLQAVPPDTVESIMLRDFYLHQLKALQKEFQAMEKERLKLFYSLAFAPNSVEQA